MDEPRFGSAAYFERIAAEVGDDWAGRALHHVRLDWCLSILGRFGRRRYRRALDLRCGYGHFSAMLAPRCGEVLGVDGAADAVRQAAGRYPHLRFLRGRLEEMEFLAGQFDLICVLDVLYYLPLEARLTQQANLARWLAPGGDLLITARMKVTPYFRPEEAEALVPAGLALLVRDDLAFGRLHGVEGFATRVVRWARRRRLGALAWPAAALCGWSGWLRAGAALLRRWPAAAPTYRLWLARKPA